MGLVDRVRKSFSGRDGEAALKTDADIISEENGFNSKDFGVGDFKDDNVKVKKIKLNIQNGSHRATKQTAKLLREVGGREMVISAVTEFYRKAIQTEDLDQFIRSHADPHGQRLGLWICQKMGDGDVWDAERRKRSTDPVEVANGHKMVVRDRTTAHVAAWNSPKRKPENVGERFKLIDARVWMRLMFWAMRDTGLFENTVFEEWFVRFIGHFVRVYERSAPIFARESLRWSENERNIEEYNCRGYKMEDGFYTNNVSIARQDLPESQDKDYSWPYSDSADFL